MKSKPWLPRESSLESGCVSTSWQQRRTFPPRISLCQRDNQSQCRSQRPHGIRGAVTGRAWDHVSTCLNCFMILFFIFSCSCYGLIYINFYKVLKSSVHSNMPLCVVSAVAMDRKCFFHVLPEIFSRRKHYCNVPSLNKFLAQQSFLLIPLGVAALVVVMWLVFFFPEGCCFSQLACHCRLLSGPMLIERGFMWFTSRLHLICTWFPSHGAMQMLLPCCGLWQ